MIRKSIRKMMITGMAACILSAAFPLIGEAAVPEKCRMLCYSGAVVTVDTAADTALSMVLGNIEAELGEEGLSAYLKAMETGDYTKFYMVQGSVTPTFLVEKYMTNAGGINLIDRRGGVPFTLAQKIERDCYFTAGRNGTVPFDSMRLAAMEAGYTSSAKENSISAFASDRAVGVTPMPRDLSVFTDEDIKKLKGGDGK